MIEKARGDDEFANQARVPDRHLQRDRASIAESKNICPLDMEVFEKSRRVIGGPLKAEGPVGNIRSVAESLLLKGNHLPVAGEFRKQFAERCLNGIAAAVQQHQGWTLRMRSSMNFVIHVKAIHRCIAFLGFHAILLFACVRSSTGEGPHGPAENNGRENNHGHDGFHRRGHRPVSFTRRSSLSRIISFRSAAGRISHGPYFTPGCFEMS